MKAWVLKMLANIVALVVEGLVKIGLKKKEEADKQKADALGKTVESVNVSVDKEKEIRDQQKAVDKTPTNVAAPDGGLNFDSFNKGEEPKPEEKKP